MSDYAIKIDVSVQDAQELATAARARGLADGLTAEHYDDTFVDSGDHLVMLLDPGSLPGCTILQSSPEDLGASDSRELITVTIEVAVHDEEALKAAALAQGLKEGLTAEHFAETFDDPGKHLIMLLDPGSLPGCSILNSDAESQDIGEDEVEDDEEEERHAP